MDRKATHTEKAPQAVGPYSQAITCQGLVFCSGQIALDPKAGILVGKDAAEQTHRVMQNLMAVLDASGSSFAGLLKTTIYLQNLEDFKSVNEVYSSYLETPYPARVTIEAGRLPLNALVEIDAIAKVLP